MKVHDIVAKSHSNRKYYISAGAAFKAIKSQPCFDINSNLQIRAAIRHAMYHSPSYYLLVDEKHKYSLDGNRFGPFSVTPKGLYEVKRMDEETFIYTAMSLRFECPICGSQMAPPHRYAYKIALTSHADDGIIICENCWSTKFRYLESRLNTLRKFAGYLEKGKVDDEQYIRLEKCVIGGFLNASSGENLPVGSEGASLRCQEYNRHIETGDCGEFYEPRQIQSGLVATAEAARRRRCVIEYFMFPESIKKSTPGTIIDADIIE